MLLYHICPPKKNKGEDLYHTYSSVVMKNYLDKSLEWKETKNKKEAHFCDCPSATKIKYYLPIKKYIYHKNILADTLGNVDYHPTTFIISNGNIYDRRYNRAVKFQNKGKWYLKPFNGGCGSGIKVLSRLSDWRKNVNPQKKYVIQKGIESILYQGRKFDLRTYILIITSKKQIHAYISKESCMRISNYQYDPKSTKKEINVTNVGYQNTTDGKKLPNSLSFREWEHYESVQPKIKEIVTKFIHKILPLIEKRTSVALLGCDFTIDKNLKPHFIEVNNKMGFGIRYRSSKDAKTLREMLYEILEIGYKPLINSQPFPKESKEWDKCYFRNFRNKTIRNKEQSRNKTIQNKEQRRNKTIRNKEQSRNKIIPTKEISNIFQVKKNLAEITQNQTFY